MLITEKAERSTSCVEKEIKEEQWKKGVKKISFFECFLD